MDPTYDICVFPGQQHSYQPSPPPAMCISRVGFRAPWHPQLQWAPSLRRPHRQPKSKHYYYLKKTHKQVGWDPQSKSFLYHPCVTPLFSLPDCCKNPNSVHSPTCPVHLHQKRTPSPLIILRPHINRCPCSSRSNKRQLAGPTVWAGHWRIGFENIVT